MHFQFHPNSIPFLAATLICAWIAAAIWPRRAVPGAPSLLVHMLGLALWNGATAVMWMGVSLPWQDFWLKFSTFGVVITPAAFLVFSIQISFNEKRLKRRWLALLAIEPLIVTLLTWTNDSHYLVYSAPQLWNFEGLAELKWQPHLWFYLDAVYMHLLYIAAILLLVRSLPRHGILHHHQIGTILVGACLPLIGDLINLTLLSRPSSNFDMFPLLFTISGGLYFYAMSQQKFLDLIPVAHSVLINSMTDGVVVLDAHDRIVEMNPAAGQFLGIIPGRVAGRDAKEIFAAWRETTQPIWGQPTVRTEINITGNVPSTIDLKIAPLLDERNRPRGRMLVFRDITLRKQNEAALKAKNKQLQEQLEENRALRDQLREQATRDPLTNLYNRRYLEEMLLQELARASRENYPVCLIMMDIDRFKLVNDTCGHKAGDEVLQALATLIVLHIRRFDAACRFGGEEFVIVMPMLSVETARERAEFLRREFAAMPIPCVKMGKSPTLSIGVASYPLDAANPEELLRLADKALYAAKSAGRDRVVVYSELEEKRMHSDK